MYGAMPRGVVQGSEHRQHDYRPREVPTRRTREDQSHPIEIDHRHRRSVSATSSCGRCPASGGVVERLALVPAAAVSTGHPPSDLSGGPRPVSVLPLLGDRTTKFAPSSCDPRRRISRPIRAAPPAGTSSHGRSRSCPGRRAALTPGEQEPGATKLGANRTAAFLADSKRF